MFLRMYCVESCDGSEGVVDQSEEGGPRVFRCIDRTVSTSGPQIAFMAF